ncbi:MAG: arsenate reductase ArsC [Kangiellaceae bacterium]|jgi:arsenate reductase|nr:arsenate reductase ArsC [Kangiellaceae bacterium]
MNLLFICTHNRCRSILSEAIFNHVAGDYLTAFSAGSQPSGQVHPLSLKYLSDSDISIDGLHSKSWDEFDNKNIDISITVCDSAAKEACPVWFGDTIKVHWGLEDPSKIIGDQQAQELAFEKTIDIITSRAKHFIELLKDAPSKQTLAARIEQLTNQKMQSH